MIYFLQFDNNLIKIGATNNYIERKSKLEKLYGIASKEVQIESDDNDSDIVLHMYFRGYDILENIAEKTNNKNGQTELYKLGKYSFEQIVKQSKKIISKTENITLNDWYIYTHFDSLKKIKNIQERHIKFYSAYMRMYAIQNQKLRELTDFWVKNAILSDILFAKAKNGVKYGCYDSIKNIIDRGHWKRTILAGYEFYMLNNK